MTQADVALLVHNGLSDYVAGRAGVELTLEVDRDWRATDDTWQLLVADDGGGALLHGHFAEPTIRVCAIGAGRTATRALAAGAADHLQTHGAAGVARLSGVTTLREGKDRTTGNVLVFFTMLAIVRPL